MVELNDQVLACIYTAVDEANEDREDLPPLARSLDTEIHGSSSSLDSLQLINFLVAIEEGIELDLGCEVMLTDERILSREPSPLGSVRALVGYVEELLGEAAAAR